MIWPHQKRTSVIRHESSRECPTRSAKMVFLIDGSGYLRLSWGGSLIDFLDKGGYIAMARGCSFDGFRPLSNLETDDSVFLIGSIPTGIRLVFFMTYPSWMQKGKAF